MSKRLTLELAEQNIGNKVVYDRPYCAKEEGVITSVNHKFVFVRYGSDCNSKATSPEDLIIAF